MDLTAKARYVADGHKTADLPFSMTYASVVSRESVRIAFLVAALNGLEVEAADIQQAYLNAPCGEKLYIVCGPEFGPEMVGRRAIVVKAAYGLKSSGCQWRNFLAEALKKDMGFVPCRADKDVYL